jgi:hypothetical protein
MIAGASYIAWGVIGQNRRGVDCVMSKDPQYPEHFVKRLEIVWARDFSRQVGPRR